MKTIKIGDDPSVYATGNDNCKTSTTGTSDQKPKELVEERDEIVRLITLCNDGNVNITEEKYSKVKNYLTQQRTELLEEISKLKIGERNENDGDDRSWNKFTYYYNQALEQVKNLLNKKDETK